MILVYIEDIKLCSKIISYLECSNTPNTTDINAIYDYIIINSLSIKTSNLVNKNITKKIIFLTYSIEPLLLNATNIYLEQVYNILNKCHKIVVTLPYFKKILKDKINKEIIVVQKEIPILSNKIPNLIIKNFYLKARKKKVLFIDLEYENIESLITLSITYPELDFILLGYKPNYFLKTKSIKQLIKLPFNVKIVKYIDFNLYIEIVRSCSLIIYNNTKIEYFDFLLSILYLKNNVLIKNTNYYDDYLINSKNTYLYDEDIELKFKKLYHNRVKNMALEGYDLVKPNTFTNISTKYKDLFN